MPNWNISNEGFKICKGFDDVINQGQGSATRYFMGLTNYCKQLQIQTGRRQITNYNKRR